MRSRACKSALGLVGLVGLATICLSALKPVDAHMAEQSDDAYAWRVFVAVNQVCGSAVPNSDQPAAWETWATRNDILREDGADPGRWKDLKAGTTAPGRFEVLSAKDLPNLRHIEGGKMVAGTDSASAAARLTEIRFNHAAFDYIGSSSCTVCMGSCSASKRTPRSNSRSRPRRSKHAGGPSPRRTGRATTPWTCSAPMAHISCMGWSPCTLPRRIYATGSGQHSSMRTMPRGLARSPGSRPRGIHSPAPAAQPDCKPCAIGNRPGRHGVESLSVARHDDPIHR